MNIVLFLVIGVLAGWVAGKLMRGRGFGLLGNMVLGIVGAVAGGFLFGLLGLHAYNFVGSFVTAIIGAVLLLLALGVRKKA